MEGHRQGGREYYSVRQLPSIIYSIRKVAKNNYESESDVIILHQQLWLR